ncbi:hypothetical protein [Microbulbifer aggregans]|uniref:hypothetical protein n=1 Tax=Microbulbifer aggregans TaxID=1769779 RepID=UPI001CFC7EC2|nr:hypothetical protein [Microbulbifer aggregans]
MKSLKIIICCFYLLCPFAIAGEEATFVPVVKLFSALSDANHSGMRSAVTDNFTLLEHGEIWDMNTLTNLVKPSKKQRKNFFSIISSETMGNSAFINYWNKAEVHDGDSKTEYIWLESVVVYKVNGEWKLQQMHSTRVEAENAPKDIKFTASYVKT